MSRTVAVAAAVAIGLAGCGGSGDNDDGALRPLVDEIVPAMAAVDVARDGPQAYFEVNATPQLVNLFVAVDDASAVVGYVWIDGELGPASPPEPAQGVTFTAADLEFDAGAVLAPTIREVPDGDLTVFAVEGATDPPVRYSIRVESERGGVLEVVVGPTGAIQSVDPAEAN